MQTNAILGLGLVLVMCWLFLGLRIAAMVTLGIIFSIAGTLWVLKFSGNTLNVSVLLGIVIVLGMLVDDAVVVVESIYYRLQRGMKGLDAAIDALREVGRPVTSAVSTTMAAFLPLMLLPGIVGKFMFVIPFVVTVEVASAKRSLASLILPQTRLESCQQSDPFPVGNFKYLLTATNRKWVFYRLTDRLIFT